MGMTYEQFWEQSPYLAVAYRKAHRIRRELDNEQAWLQGLYSFDAFAVCLANAFRKRGQKAITYMERPIDIFPLSVAEKKRRAEEENKKMEEAMRAMMRRQQRKKKQKGENNG